MTCGLHSVELGWVLQFPALVPGPEGAIYDDVPRENSDSEPGLVVPATVSFPLDAKLPPVYTLPRCVARVCVTCMFCVSYSVSPIPGGRASLCVHMCVCMFA